MLGWTVVEVRKASDHIATDARQSQMLVGRFAIRSLARMRFDDSVQSPKVPRLGPDHMAFGTWKSAIPHAPCELWNIQRCRARATKKDSCARCTVLSSVYPHVERDQVSTRCGTSQHSTSNETSHSQVCSWPRNVLFSLLNTLHWGVSPNSTDAQLTLSDSSLPSWPVQIMWGLSSC